MMRRPLAVAVPLLVPVLLRAQGAQRHVTVVPLPAITLPLKLAPEVTTPGITAHDLMTRLYIFADDSMQGRETGTIGNVRGTDYIAREAKRIGLLPAGESGTYFQTLPFKTRMVDPGSTIAVDGTPLAAADWGLAASPSEAISVPSAPVLYGGVVGDSAGMLAVGSGVRQFVVFLLPPGGAGSLAEAVRRAKGAAAVGVVGADEYIPYFAHPQTFLDHPTDSRTTAPVPILVLSTTAGAQLFDRPLGQVAPGAAGRTATVKIRVSTVAIPYPARNVVAILPGRDPALKGEYVAIGAHNDHIGINDRPVDHDSLRIFNHLVQPGGAEDRGTPATPAQQAQVNAQLAAWRTAHPTSARLDSINNGADDDGSGSVSVLEIAEKMAAVPTKPKRSMLFVWHVGEEKGLLGSAWFTDHPTIPRDSIVAQLNIDMVGRGDAWDVTGVTKAGAVVHGGASYVQLVGSRRLSTELGNLAEQVNLSGQHGLTLDYSMDENGHPMNIYCRSDHYEYARYGIPIIFFTTGGHSDYHQVTDEPQYIDYDHMARVDNFIADVAFHVADLDHRVVVDHPKPDPKAACRQ